MRRVILLVALYLLADIPAAVAADSLALYSDACWHRGAGDLLGYRFAIIRLPDATYVLFQAAEGAWSSPSIGKVSAKDLARGNLVFAVSDDGKPISFRGSISEKMVAGRFDGLFGLKGEPLVVRLGRVPVSQRTVPDCR